MPWRRQPRRDRERVDVEGVERRARRDAAGGVQVARTCPASATAATRGSVSRTKRRASRSPSRTGKPGDDADELARRVGATRQNS